MSWGENEKAMIPDMAVTATTMLEAAGAKNIEPFTVLDRMPGYGIHEMGTARMGNDPRTSVLTPFLRTHDISNLYVMDASSFVSGGCQNPTLTLMALAVRGCDYLMEEMRRGSAARLGKRGDSPYTCGGVPRPCRDCRRSHAVDLRVGGVAARPRLRRPRSRRPPPRPRVARALRGGGGTALPGLHSARRPRTSGATRLEGCDPGSHAVAVVFTYVAPHPDHVPAPVPLEAILVAPPAPAWRHVTPSDVRAHSPPRLTDTPLRAPPVVHLA